MPNYWTGDYEEHLRRHNRLESKIHTVVNDIGTKSATFTKFVWMPPHEAVTLNWGFLVQDADVVADDTDYWSYYLIQKDGSDKEYTLIQFDGNRRGFTADRPQRFPLNDQYSGRLRLLPVFLKGVKTGSPSATSGLAVQICWSTG